MATMSEYDDLYATQRPLVLWVAGSMIAVSVISVSLRFISRMVTKVPLLLDDWLILVTLPISVATFTITIWGTLFHGFGTHVAATASYDSLHNFLRGLYVFEITYVFSIAGSKFSMMAIYWRIFPHPNMKWPLRITAALTGAFLIATTLVPIFTCNPIQGFWLFEIDKECIDSLRYFIAASAVNITLDVAMLLIPIVMVMRLQISKVQKVAVSGVFGLGIFVTACSCIRLNQLIIASSNGLYIDPTWNLIGPALWSDIEAAASIVCACLPTMRPLLRLFLRGTFKSTRGTHSGTQRSGRGDDGETHTFYRVGKDRPLSGMDGDGEWMGKGVGAPAPTYQAQVQTSAMHLELTNCPLSPLSPMFPRDHLRDSSVMSSRPPVPSRNPLRRFTQSFSGPSPSADASLQEKQPAMVSLNAITETPILGRSRRASFDRFELPADAPPMPTSTPAAPAPAAQATPDTRSKTLVRDPVTQRYVMSAARSAARLSPDYDLGWEEELDRGVAGAWDPSRAGSRAHTRPPSVCSSMYEAQAVPVHLANPLRGHPVHHYEKRHAEPEPEPEQPQQQQQDGWFRAARENEDEEMAYRR